MDVQGMKGHMGMFTAGRSAASADERAASTENAHQRKSCVSVVINLVISRQIALVERLKQPMFHHRYSDRGREIRFQRS